MISGRLSAFLALLLLMPICSGCGIERGPFITVRDSAGIRIVEVSAEALAEVPSWRASEEPDLVIGSAEGDAAYQLYEVVDAATTASKNIAVLMDRELRIFDPAGRFIRRLGRAGQGPGEMQAPSRVITKSDSLVVLDEYLQRITVFSESGEVVRMASIEPPLRNPRLGGVFGDGTLLIIDDRYRRPSRGFEVVESHMMRYDAEGRLLDTLPKQPLAEMGYLDVTDIVTMKTFGALTATAADLDGYWVAKGPPELARYDRSGHMVRIVRWDAGNLSITTAAVKQHIDAAVASYDLERQPIARRELVETAVADRYPATQRAIASPHGELWVERYRPFTYTGPTDWLVFSKEGRIVGQCILPAGFELLEAGATYVLGKMSEPDDVDRITRYSVHRPH